MSSHPVRMSNENHDASHLGIIFPAVHQPNAKPKPESSGGENDGDLISADDCSNDHQNAAATLHSSATGVIHLRKPSDVGLHIQTNIPSAPPPSSHSRTGSDNSIRLSLDDEARPSTLRPPFLSRRSFENSTTASASPASSVTSSPKLTSLHDVTPLPSPLLPSASSDIWKMVAGRPKSNSQTSNSSMLRDDAAGLLPPPVPFSPPVRKKKLHNFVALSNQHVFENAENHERNRSISDTRPDALQNVRPRHVTTPGGPLTPLKEQGNTTPPAEVHMHREDYLSVQRGITKAESKSLVHNIPSPPPSNRSTISDEGEDSSLNADKSELLTIRNHLDGRVTRWTILRSVGQGSFSQVMLATPSRSDDITFEAQPNLVAIKIMAHAPAGGTDEERVDTSIKREIEILGHVSHPCLPHMRAYEDTLTRALIVLDYCPGGDMFEFATRHRSLLTPVLIQRIFAELVDVVSYLHSQFIVHRDIKLENVLFNITSNQLPSDPTTYPYPIITLTDLGLSKRIPPPPASALLNHPCGSEDYIAPEILLGQPYEGRSTDAWALGVLLYALIESRLPFDILQDPRKPHKTYKSEFERQRAKKHRIARCEWIWCEYGDEWGEWVSEKAAQASPPGLEGARECVEGLLKKVSRGRFSVQQLSEREWIKNGIRVADGLKPRPQQ